jgi:small-conductance mechanosensitive channel
MASDYETQDATETLTIEGLSAIALAPIVLPAAAILEQPLAKAALKESIAFSQRCQEAVAQARERLDDAMAEIQADLGEQQQAEANGKAEQTYVPQTKAQTFTEVMDSMDDLNEQVKRLTNGREDFIKNWRLMVMWAGWIWNYRRKKPIRLRF